MKRLRPGLRSVLTTSVCCGFRLIVSLTIHARHSPLTVSLAVDNVMAILNSTTPPADFSPHEYQRLIEKYLTLSQENDQLVKAIRSGNQTNIDHIRQVLRTDFPLYARLQDYFSRLRARDPKSVDQTPFVPEDPVLGGGEVLSRSVDVNMEGVFEMQLASERDLDSMSIFSSAETSVFAERPPAIPNQGPFGIRFSDFPPRVISQMLSTHTDVTASSCRCLSRVSLRVYPYRLFVASWRGLFTWAGFEHASRAKKFMRLPMIGLSATNGKDLYVEKIFRGEIHTYTLTIFAHRRAHTWPQNMVLVPSGTKRVNDAALKEWIKRYDPMWCQFVPHHSKGGSDAVMNDLVYRQLVQRLIDQRLVSYLAFYSFDETLSRCLQVRRRFMGRPKLPWPPEHSPTLTLQHVRANRSRFLKHRKTRTSDTIGTKLARRSDFTLRKPSSTGCPENRTPIVLRVQRSDTDRRKGPILRREFRPCNEFGIRA